MWGGLILEDETAVAIVGTRQPTDRSLAFAEVIGMELAERGLTVVSGLAAGVDTAALRGALDSQSGRTLAVLGSGIRVIHPRSNEELAEQISSRGALLSELHPNAPPRGLQLMARDRIISGLSQAVIVVEAGLKSGSLDTASRGKKQGRPIYAVPVSEGTDFLFQEGARVLDPDTIDFDDLTQEIIDTPALEPSPEPRQDRLF